MSLKQFEVLKELGKGAFASVSLVKRKEDSKIYALKKVKITQMSGKEKENALNEIRLLASVPHVNIIGYKDSFFDEETRLLCIIMEYADDGDLEGKIQKHIKNKTNFPENEVWSILIQITQGIKALHDNKIMHRDLKSANIFMMKNGLLKLGDFNVSKVIKNSNHHTQTGTPYYCSPEIWSDKPYDYKCDVWSVGCVVYELCALRPPFGGNSLDQLYKNIMKGNIKIIFRYLYSNSIYLF